MTSFLCLRFFLRRSSVGSYRPRSVLVRRRFLCARREGRTSPILRDKVLQGRIVRAEHETVFAAGIEGEQPENLASLPENLRMSKVQKLRPLAWDFNLLD